ncbi:hypothetical protein JRQ81_010480 [Phrynocephalus forsythii]|uniref:Fibronectin type-III domain-containing protein n=1 Tax=Phrynocephalus forsythii TaxID=171643 RepID=A0A9Q0XBY5_9SAUR|nr:hypothetical protein JRQ81_010480 [Phrynocephalus forsythii]
MGAERFRVEAAFDGGGPGDAPLRRCGKDFGFHDHVKPSPPFNLTALASPDGYTLSWETRYRPLDFLDGELQYELGYRRRGHPWPGPSQKRLPQDTRTLQLRPQELDAGAEYELRVRARPRESSLYRGTWSDWSPPATLETLPETPGEAHWLLLLLLIFFPALLALLGWRQRLWKKLDRFVPSPAPFFQPLFLVHKGDFKRWVGASSARAVLDISEWEAVVPEVCQKIGTKYLLPPPSLPEGGSGWKDGQAAMPVAVLPSSQQIPADSHRLEEQEETTPQSIPTATSPLTR